MSQERFDELVRALATNQVSRGQMLKLAGGAFLGSVLGGFGLATGIDEADAKKKKGRKNKKKKRHTSALLNSALPRICSTASRCGSRQYCNAEQTCICVQSVEGDARCGKLPDACNVKLCQTSADCA